MFVEGQKLELFHRYKPSDLSQILAWLAYRPSIMKDLLTEMVLVQLFQQIRAWAAYQFSFKVSILMLLETSPVWLRNRYARSVFFTIPQVYFFYCAQGWFIVWLIEMSVVYSNSLNWTVTISQSPNAPFLVFCIRDIYIRYRTLFRSRENWTQISRMNTDSFVFATILPLWTGFQRNNSEGKHVKCPRKIREIRVDPCPIKKCPAVDICIGSNWRGKLCCR